MALQRVQSVLIQQINMDPWEQQANVTSLNVSSRETLEVLNARYAAALLPFSVILGCIGFFGIVGNIFVFIVYGFGRKFKDKKFRYYVLTLAVIDFITCLTLIPAEIIKNTSYFYFTERILCKVKCFFNVFAASSASYCLVLVAADRFIMTCHPLFYAKSQKYSFNFARWLCVLTLILGVLTSIPAAVMCGITHSTMADKTGTHLNVSLCESEPYFAKDYARYIYRIALCAVQTIISFIMIVLYARIGHAVMKVLHIRQNTNNGAIELSDLKSGDHHKNSHSYSATDLLSCRPCHPHIPNNIKLLFIVTVVFIVTYIFYMSLSWVDQKKLSPAQFFFFSVFFRLYFIHSIINPFLYMKMDKYFRKRCIQILQLIFRCKTH